MQNIDLNLLRVFDTLIETRSVTRAAERLGLTQPAVSHALGRLRREIDDPLFLRGSGGLQPTARAEELAPGIREGLRQLRGALAPPMFDPAHATRHFTIATGQYFCTLLVPILIERLLTEAPGVTLHVVPVNDALVSSIDRGTIDVALTGFVKLPARFGEDVLYIENMVWIAAGGHPLASAPAFDAAGMASVPRVMLSVGRLLDVSQAAAVDAIHEQDFLTGPPGAAPGSEQDVHTVYDSQTAIAIAARTNMVAFVPQRIAERARHQENIAILKTTADTTSFPLSMFWHRKQKADPGLTWLRALILKTAGTL